MLIFDQLNKADRHLRALAWVLVLGMLTLMSGLWWVQVVRSRQYVEDQRTQSYRTIRVPAPRGRILDREGAVLAENRPVYSISLYLEDRSWRDAVQREFKRAEAAARKTATAPRSPKTFEKILGLFGYRPNLTQSRKLGTAEKNDIGRQARYTVTSNIVWQLGAALGQPLTIDEKKFEQHYELRRALPLPILPNLEPNQIARFQEQSTHLPGVDMEMQPVRVYPFSTNACHVVGCLTHSDDLAEGELASYNYQLPDYKGYSGVEAAWDDDLRGRAGAKAVLVNNLGYRQSETILSPVEAGRNVTLTIDMDVQREAENALLAAPLGVGRPIRGAAVVLDVRTGEVIALVSVPHFDPNDWVPYLPKATWDSYTNQDIAPLQNRAVYGNFFPGSTFKIVVALAGLERGTLDPEETLIVEPNRQDPSHGAFYLEDRSKPWRDVNPPGEYKFRRAFIKSSNSYFIQEGLLAGPEAITTLAYRLGFGQKTGIVLPEGAGILPTPRNQGGWSRGDTANISIGQGSLAVTPLQLAVAVAAVANGGKVLVPQLILRTTAQNELIPPSGGTHLKPVIREEVRWSPRTLALVREAMLADVMDPEGSGKESRVAEYPVCGKTGTAQVFLHNTYHHHTVWFASYGPAEDPRYSVIVMADHAGSASGGGACAPIARRIYEKLKYRDLRLQERKSTVAIR